MSRSSRNTDVWPGPSRPLADVEQELLEAIALNPHDDELRRVLADYWMQGPDPARGEMVALQCGGGDASELLELYRKRWLGVLVDEGYAFEFERGFVRLPLVFEAGDPLAEAADTRRVSPRVYMTKRSLDIGRRPLFIGRSWAGADVLIKGSWHEYTRGWMRRTSRTEPHRDGDVFSEGRIVPRHPHIVELLDMAQLDGGEVLVYAWAGEPLDDRSPQPDEVVIPIGRQIASAVAALHAAGISHRNICSEHVLIEDGHARLAGFGRAVSDAVEIPLNNDPDYDPPWPPTRQFANMSPEEIRTHQYVRSAADVFSLGVTLAHWCLGQHPLGNLYGQSTLDVAFAARDRRHQMPTATALAPLLEAMLAEQPEARPTAADVAAQLTALEHR